MKRVILSILILMSVATPGIAQYIKVENGVVISSMHFDKLDLLNDKICTYALLAGLDYWKHRNYYLSSEIGYLTKGGKDEILFMDTESTYNKILKEKWDFLHINTTFRLRYPVKNNHFYFGVGLKANILLNAHGFKNINEPGFEMNDFSAGLKAELGASKDIGNFRIGINASWLPDFGKAGKIKYADTGTSESMHERTAMLLISAGYRLK